MSQVLSHLRTGLPDWKVHFLHWDRTMTLTRKSSTDRTDNAQVVCKTTSCTTHQSQLTSQLKVQRWIHGVGSGANKRL